MYRILQGRIENASRVVVRKASEGARVKEAMEHADVPGAGAKKRKKLKGQRKVHAVMGEFKRGTLHSGSGGKVASRKQAIAIAMSEAGLSRKAVGDILREDAIALLKSRGLLQKAKYLRREGGPGNYKYFYREEGSKRSKKSDKLSGKYGDKTVETAIRSLLKLPLSKLRRNQDVIDAQFKLVEKKDWSESKKREVIADLQSRRDVTTAAIRIQNFGGSIKEAASEL